MDKILFIIPPYVGFDNYVNPAFNERTVIKKTGIYGSVVTDMPIGLLSLSAYLKKHTKVEIRLIDFNIILNKLDTFEYKSFSDLYSRVLLEKEFLDYNPDIIGISALFTPTYYNMLDVAQTARKVFSDSLIIAGGGIATNMPKEIFKDSACFDALCYGEGENPLLALIRATNKKEFLETNSSWITKNKLANGDSFHFDLIYDLDEIPYYDYGIINVRDYGLSPTVKSYASFDDNNTIFHVATSRGCVHRCCFCSSHTVHGRKMRYHSVERIRDDLTHLKEKYGAKKIGIQDDNFMFDKKRAIKIINIVKELEMDLFFQSGLALYALDREMLEVIKNAGLKEIVLAIESGSNRVLKEIMHKPIDLSMVKRVIKDCRELGIDTDANILIGLPGETKEDIEDSRNFLKTLDANWFRIYVATPLVGSEMYNTCIKNNYLKTSHIGSDFKRAVIETDNFTAEYIQEKAYSLNLELNFVNNSDFRLGNYLKALKGFENTIKVKNDHAFAYYFGTKCCKILGMDKKHREYNEVYNRILKESVFWKSYVDQFGLTNLG